MAFVCVVDCAVVGVFSILGLSVCLSVILTLYTGCGYSLELGGYFKTY